MKIVISRWKARTAGPRGWPRPRQLGSKSLSALREVLFLKGEAWCPSLAAWFRLHSLSPFGLGAQRGAPVNFPRAREILGWHGSKSICPDSPVCREGQDGEQCQFGGKKERRPCHSGRNLLASFLPSIWFFLPSGFLSWRLWERPG